MSLKAIVWVLENSDAKLGDRLTLLALADHADDDGGDAYPSVPTIARKAGMSERQVQRCLKKLCSEKRLIDEGVSTYGTRRYRIVMEDLSEADSTGDNLSVVTSTTEIAHDLSPEPSFEPSLQSEQGVPVLALTAKDARGVTRARPWKVDRQPVSVQEEALARGALGQWNVQTGQNLTSKEWLNKIVLRIREHPELGIGEHEHIIAAALAEPWWDGHPSPSVVYGNGAQFERCITAARNGHAPARPKASAMRYGRGMTTRQILDEYAGR